MRRLTQYILFFVISAFLSAANPFQEPLPETPTPTPLETCLTEGFPECIPNVFRAYGIWAVLLLVISLIAFVFLKAEFSNWLSGWKKFRQKDTEEVFNRWEVDEVTRDYLKKVIEDYRHFKFRGLDNRTKGIETPELDQAYVTIQMIPDADHKPVRDSKEAPEKISLGSPEAFEWPGQIVVGTVTGGDELAPLSLVKAVHLAPRLAVIGGAGSGKSTLLQWAGLACARAVVESGKLTPEQLDFTKAAGDRPLLPVLIPLRAFNRYCIDHKHNRTARTLLEFITATIVEKHPALKLPPDFFEIHLRQKGCLVMFDGVDEVDPDDRERIREAIEALVAEYKDNPRNRYLVTSRTVAYFGAAEVSGFRKCRVQNLTPEQRDLLIRNWCLAAYGGDEATIQAGDLCHRINISDERVQALTITPLMVTIFALVHYDRRELPRQRAELYEHAVRIILTEPYKEGEAAAELKRDWETRRNRLAFIAFEMHSHQLDKLPEDDLVDLIWREFGTPDQEKLARQAGRDFIRRVADRGGLLEEESRRYGFFTHRTFLEFLAGRYLAEERTAEEQTSFLLKVLDQDTWIEPVRLAAGYLAIHGELRANQFISLLAGLGDKPEQRVQALTLAGLALSDLPPVEPPSPKRVELTQKIVDEMVARLSDNPPPVQPFQRNKLGLALGELGDPRLDPLHPRMVPVPAGPFRMGTNEQDQERLKAQEAQYWGGEESDQVLYLSDYQIGMYPVTNAEFQLFKQRKGYEPDEAIWGLQGLSWLMGTREQDLAEFPERLREDVNFWLEKRPPDRRLQPFFWDDPAWSGKNLPVVGVCWFEAQAYCKWLSRETGLNYRLPSEAEWEKAARGPDGFLWPWGDEWDAQKCNCRESNEEFRGTTPVGMYPQGHSPCGALDMVGNVWEWTGSLYEAYPYIAEDGREDPEAP